MNSKFDSAYPDEIVKRGEYYTLYDDMEKIMKLENCGKIVINLYTDDLKSEYNRIKALNLGTEI